MVMLIKYHVNILYFCALLIFLSSCTPYNWNEAQDALRRNDIVSAIHFTALTLKDKPGYEAAVKFLQSGFPDTYNNFYRQAKQAESFQNYDLAFDLYVTIQRLSDIIATIPPQPLPDTSLTVTFPLRNVREDIERTRNLAAESHYQCGLDFEKRGIFKEAALAYKASMDFIDNYKDSWQKYNETRNMAVKRVAVMAFDDNSGKRGFGDMGEIISQMVISRAMSNPVNLEFLEFVSRDRVRQLISENNMNYSNFIDNNSYSANGKLLGIHAFVFGTIMSVAVDMPPETRDHFKESKVIKDDKKMTKDTVYAHGDIITRKIFVRIMCSYRIVEVPTGRIIKTDIIPYEKGVEVQFGKYKGDERALSGNYHRLCNTAESYPPSPEIMVNNALPLIADQIAEDVVFVFK